MDRRPGGAGRPRRRASSCITQPPRLECDAASHRINSGTPTLWRWRTKESRSWSFSVNTPTSASPASISRASTAARSSAPSTDGRRPRSPPLPACRSGGRATGVGSAGACWPTRPTTFRWRGAGPKCPWHGPASLSRRESRAVWFWASLRAIAEPKPHSAAVTITEALVRSIRAPRRLILEAGGYAAVGGPNQVVSASGSPRWVRSPTQATYPSGRINTAVGTVTAPSTGTSHSPA